MVILRALFKRLLHNSRTGHEPVDDSCDSHPVERAPSGVQTLGEAAAFADFVQGLAPEYLVAVETMVRNGEWNPYIKLERSAYRGLHEGGLRGVALSAFASMNRDGRVREAAVLGLARMTTGEELPYLLLRLNDWVRPIRVLAAEAVLSRLTPDYAEAFLRCSGLVLRLSEGQRGDNRPLFRKIAAFLHRNPISLARMQAHIRMSPALMRKYLKLLLESDEVHKSHAIELALASSDPGLRVQAARDARELFDWPDLTSLLPTMLADRSPAVRGEALKAVIQRSPEPPVDVLTEALFDPNAWNRMTARYHLEQAGVTDIADIYRREADNPDPRRQAAAISGLAETGGLEALPLITARLGHPAAIVRREAVHALGGSHSRAFRSELHDALEDVSAGVGREAVWALEQNRELVDLERVRTLFSGTGPSHVRKAALRLGAGMGRWGGLPWILEAMADADEQVARLGRELLEAWLRRKGFVFTRPTVEQTEAARRVLDRIGTNRSKDLLELVRDELARWSGTQ